MHGTEKQEIYYRITPKQQIVQFERIDGIHMYQNKVQGSFIRKAVWSKTNRIVTQRPFVDPEFSLEQKSSYYKVTRLYHLYKKQVPLFPQDEQFSSFIENHEMYNSFMSESGLVSYDYLRTLFITQSINQDGYYEYFVKKNGEYFLQCCDDLIPVHKITKKPLWNLNQKHPWQLLLFKVWLKLCGSYENLFRAEPFRLLDAFGLPQYQVFNFRKQLIFLRNEKLAEDRKKINEKMFAMNKNDVIILAKTINDESVRKVGLLPNFAAYRVLRITKPDEVSLYRVFSTLPCYWVGSYSPVSNTQLNKVYNPQMFLDLQRNFLMTQKQLISYFNKFYVVPFQLSEPERIITQDCINITVYKGKPTWLSFEAKGQGMLAVSIQLPKIRDSNKNYPEFRYFLSKHNNQQEVARSHYRNDFIQNGNKYIQSTCDKWDCYTIDYVQGYHNSSSFFCRAIEGFYVLYIDADYNGIINVRFDTYVPITKPSLFFPKMDEVKQIFDSTFFAISQDIGIEASFQNNKFQESISLNNSFQQLGYGSISIRTLQKAKHKIAMRIFPQKLRKAGYRLLQHYQYLQQDKNRQKNFILVSSKGRPQIVVLQKIQKRNQNTIGTIFPPPGTVQFFRLTPNLNN